MNKKTLILPITILLASIILGGFYYASQVNQKKPIEKQQNTFAFPSAQKEETEIGTPQVKKSTTGICHEKGSTYYYKTTNFISFSSIEECLVSGGRLPIK